MLTGISSFVAALAASSSPFVPAPPPAAMAPALSPAAGAAAMGDFHRARTLPAASMEEALYLEASIALAEHRIDDAEAMLERLPPASYEAVELAWRAAHARGNALAIHRTAVALCNLGDRTGRSCADAELYGAAPPPHSVELRARTEVPLSPTAPLPALAVELAGANGRTAVGAVIDTGASQTVISPALAQRLGLSTTARSFPVGIAAGGAIVEARLAVLPALALGGVTSRNLPVLVMDMGNLEQVGISVVLSPQHAFDGLQIVIDFARNVFAVESPAQMAMGEPYYRLGFDLAVKAQVGTGPAALFAIDTGLDGAVAVSSRYPTAVPASLGPIALQGAGGGALAARTAPLPVRIGGRELSPEGACVVSEMPSGRPFELAGLLGNGLWKRARLVLNTRAHRLAIETQS